MKNVVCGCLVLALLFIASAKAEIVQYHPNAPIYIGGNFDPSYPGRAFPECIERTFVRGESILPGQTAGTPSATEFFIKSVKSRRELYRMLNVSLSMSGSYGLFSADFKGSLEQENTFDESQYTWVIYGYSSFGKFILDSVKLRKEAADLANNPIGFRNRCGTDYAAIELRAVQAAAVFTIKNLSESERRVLEASFSANYGAGGGPLSIAGDAKYSEFVKKAASYGQIQVSLHAIGGPGVSALSPIITNLENPSIVLKTIENYFSALTLDRSVAVSYNTASLQSLINRPNIETDVYNKFIADSFIYFEELAAEEARLHRLIGVRDDLALTQAQVEKISGHAVLLANLKQKTMSDALRCKDAFNDVNALPSRRRQLCLATASSFKSFDRPFANLSPNPYYLRYFVSNELIPGEEVLNFSIRGPKLKLVKLVKKLDVSTQAFTEINSIGLKTDLDGSRFGGTSVTMKSIPDSELPIGLRIETENGRIYFERFAFSRAPAASAALLSRNPPVRPGTVIEKGPSTTKQEFEKALKAGMLPPEWTEKQ